MLCFDEECSCVLVFLISDR